MLNAAKLGFRAAKHGFRKIKKTYKWLRNSLKNELDLFCLLSLSDWISLKKTKTNRPVSIKIQGERVFVRKGTPDVKVAISSLTNEFNFIEKLLRPDFGGLIIDGGGYIGTAAIMFSKMYPNATVVTVEPSEKNFAVLGVNVSEYENIKPIKAALSYKDGVNVDLFDRGTSHWGYTIVSNPRDCAECAFENAAVTITVEKITEHYRALPLGIVKLDIEGGEKDLIERSAQSLRDFPVLVLETHDRIVSGCKDAFLEFSSDRWTIRTQGEKYVSLSRGE